MFTGAQHMAKAKEPGTKPPAEDQADVCGIIMPISATPSYEAVHWSEVRIVLDRAIEKTGRRPQAVWEGDRADIIQEKIIGNLYNNPIIICDTSGLNPNVMLELGIRLSFGKPTIIVTDDLDTLPFDTKVIESLQYPRDLHLLVTEKFIDDLSDKINSISEKVSSNSYRPFIKTFGPIEPGSPGDESRSIDDVILQRMDRLSTDIRNIKRSISPSAPDLADIRASQVFSGNTQLISIDLASPGAAADAIAALRGFPGARSLSLGGGSPSPDIRFVVDSPSMNVVSEVSEYLRARGILVSAVSSGPARFYA
jgi:hypothetical protein